MSYILRRSWCIAKKIKEVIVLLVQELGWWAQFHTKTYKTYSGGTITWPGRALEVQIAPVLTHGHQRGKVHALSCLDSLQNGPCKSESLTVAPWAP